VRDRTSQLAIDRAARGPGVLGAMAARLSALGPSNRSWRRPAGCEPKGRVIRASNMTVTLAAEHGLTEAEVARGCGIMAAPRERDRPLLGGADGAWFFEGLGNSLISGSLTRTNKGQDYARLASPAVEPSGPSSGS
jgi:hypothetical protein